MKAKTPHSINPPPRSPEGLVGAETLLKSIWPDPATRPSLRWLREQQRKRILPFVKCGRLVFFDPFHVRKVLDNNFTVKAG